VQEREPPWKPAAIRDLYEASTPLMRRVQVLLAESPGQEISASKIAETLNVPRSSLAGAIGAYSGFVYRRLGRWSWPFTVRRDQSARQTYYSMPAEVAAEILEAARNGAATS
jgi:hypothetical protein